MSRALLALGANAGDRAVALDAAVRLLDMVPDVRVLARSRWHETAPVGGPAGQDAFLNGAVSIETSLAPESLLDQLLDIERTLGRERTVVWGPRTIDIDLLLYDELRIDTPRLCVPHPRMAVRRFVLAPAVEIAAEWRDSASGWTIERLWRHLREAFPYFAVTSVPGASATRLARDVLRTRHGEILANSLPRTPTVESLVACQRERRQLLARAASLAPPVISDFWYGEAPALARAWGVERARQSDESDAMERRDETASGDAAVLAEIIAKADAVMLAEAADAPPPPLEPKVCIWVEPAAVDDENWRRWSRVLREAATSPGHGPWLCVSEADWEGAVREIAAVIAGS